jgi:hypothetical protein
MTLTNNLVSTAQLSQLVVELKTEFSQCVVANQDILLTLSQTTVISVMQAPTGHQQI